MNIFVAQLNFKVDNDYLKEIFSEYGEVTSAKVITDKSTGRSKGYGFVDMPDEKEALNAIEELNGAEVEGKTIVVKRSNPKTESTNRESRGHRRS
jgi:RNA recognition motif-containing protein